MSRNRAPIGRMNRRGIGSGNGGGSLAPPPFTGPTYVGIVASRGSVAPTSLLTSTSSYMSRKFFDATENVRDIQIVLPNFAVTSNGVAETSSGGTLTCSEAYLEYPAGNLQRIKFGGSNSGSTAGIYLTSDLCALATYVPKGSRAFIVFAAANTVAMPVSTVTTPTFGTPQYVAGGDATQVGGTDPHNVVDDGSNNSTWPLVIAGTTQNPTFSLMGDSRQVLESSAGPLYNLSDSTGRVGEALRALGGTYGVLNVATPGDKASTFVAAFTNRIALAKLYTTHAFCGYGINELGETGATILGFCNNIREMVATMPFYGAAVAPKSTSTDVFVTTGNQTTVGNVNRSAFNTLVRANPVTWTQALDIASFLEWSGSPAGVWNAPNYTFDGLHAQANGNKQIVFSFGTTPAYTPPAAITAATAGVELWLEGDVGVTTVAGPLVTTWLDQSSNALSCTAAGALRPTTSTNINGLQCISFSGSTALILPAFANLGGKLIVVVCKNAGTGFVEQIPLVLRDTGGAHSELQFIVFTGYKKINFQCDESASGNNVGFDTTLDTAAHSYVVTYIGGTNTDPLNYQASLDGVTQIPAASGSNVIPGTNDGSIGGRLTAALALSNGYIGDIAFIMVADLAHAKLPAFRAGLKLKLAKWGVQ